jgi:hypothetical protein
VGAKINALSTMKAENRNIFFGVKIDGFHRAGLCTFAAVNTQFGFENNTSTGTLDQSRCRTWFNTGGRIAGQTMNGFETCA